MERILNDDEKIRRAEEIYYRRNHRNVSISQRNEPRKQKTYLGSKILLEMLILVILAVIVFAVKNKDYIFTESFLNNLAQYNVNLTEKFNFIMSYFVEDEKTDEVFISNEQTTNTENTQAQNNTTENSVLENNAQPVQTQGRRDTGTISTRCCNRYRITKKFL